MRAALDGKSRLILPRPLPLARCPPRPATPPKIRVPGSPAGDSVSTRAPATAEEEDPEDMHHTPGAQ